MRRVGLFTLVVAVDAGSHKTDVDRFPSRPASDGIPACRSDQRLERPRPELLPDRPTYVVGQEEGARMLDIMRSGFPRRAPGKRIDTLIGDAVPPDKRLTSVRNQKLSLAGDG